MNKSTKTKGDDIISVEEASRILDCDHDVIQIRFANRSLSKRYGANGEACVSRSEVLALAESPKPFPTLPGETTAEYARRMVATWPPLSTETALRVRTLLGLDDEGQPGRGPSPYELEQRRKLQEREEALRKAKKAAESLTACDVCNLQPDAHSVRRAQGIDMHEWQPGRAEKLLKAGK